MPDFFKIISGLPWSCVYWRVGTNLPFYGTIC